MGQIFCIALVEPAGQKYPALQGPEQEEEVCPAVPYRPAGHCAVHVAAVCAVALPKYPALHCPLQAAEVRLMLEP